MIDVLKDILNTATIKVWYLYFTTVVELLMSIWFRNNILDNSFCSFILSDYNCSNVINIVGLIKNRKI